MWCESGFYIEFMFSIVIEVINTKFLKWKHNKVKLKQWIRPYILIKFNVIIFMKYIIQWCLIYYNVKTKKIANDIIYSKAFIIGRTMNSN